MPVEANRMKPTPIAVWAIKKIQTQKVELSGAIQEFKKVGAKDMVASFENHIKDCDRLIKDIEEGPAMRAALKQLTDAYELRRGHTISPAFIDAVEKAQRMAIIAVNPGPIKTV